MQSGHAYSIVKLYDIKELGHKVIQIINPWGRTQNVSEWNGDYSDTWDGWQKNKRIYDSHGMKKKGNSLKDGQFYMELKDFINFFTYVTVCKINDNYFRVTT